MPKEISKLNCVVLFSTGWPEYMIELANAMSNHVYVVLMLPENHKLTRQHRALIGPDVQFEPFKVVLHKSIRDNFKMLFEIYKIFTKYKPEIIHIQANGHNNFHFIIPFLFFRPAIINTIHDPDYHAGDKVSLKLKRKNTKFWSRLFTTHYLVHGEKLKSELSKQYKVDIRKISSIYHGHFGIYKQFHKDKKIEENPFMVLFFGRIWKYKGLEYFIKAAKLVMKELPQAKFCIAGQGEDMMEYEGYFGGDKTGFIFKNYRIPMEEAGKIYQNSAIVVLPYIEATQSGVIPVAFAYGKPVVASNVGAISEVVDDGINGFLVEPCDEYLIAEKILFLLRNPQIRKEMGEKAFQKTLNELSWDNIAKETLEIYKKVL